MAPRRQLRRGVAATAVSVLAVTAAMLASLPPPAQAAAAEPPDPCTILTARAAAADLGWGRARVTERLQTFGTGVQASRTCTIARGKLSVTITDEFASTVSGFGGVPGNVTTRTEPSLGTRGVLTYSPTFVSLRFTQAKLWFFVFGESGFVKGEHGAAAASRAVVALARGVYHQLAPHKRA